MLKKMLTLMLILVLALSSLAACGAAQEEGTTETPADEGTTETPAEEGGDDTAEGLQPEEGAKLKIWADEGSNTDILKVAAEQFTAKYGVEFEYEPVGLGDTPTKLQTDGPAGLGADVFEAPHDHLGNMIAAGLIYANDVSDSKEFVDAAVNGTSFDGTFYGYPTAIETYALFYNKDLVGDKLPKTWDDIIEFSKGFNDIDNEKFGFMMEVGNHYYGHMFISSFGGYEFGDNGTNPEDMGLNNDGAVKGAEYYRSLKEILPLTSTDITGDVKIALFSEGNLAFNMDGPWAVKGYRDAGVNFGVMPFPKFGDKDPKSFSGVRSLFVSSFTKYPIAAKMFADFATSKEIAKLRYEQNGQIPPRTDLLEDPAIKSDPISAAFLEQAQFAEPMPSIPEMPAVWSTMNPALALIWDSEPSEIKSILDNAVQQIKDANATRAE